MFAVIFRAVVRELDDDYFATATRLRELAFEEYGCIDFVSANEGNTELAISYWPSREHISSWRNNPEHRAAQEKGKSLWYQSYQIEITEVLQSHGADLHP